MRAGDFFVDPIRPVARAVIAHGHGDHARPNNAAILATPGRIGIMRVRYGEAAGGSLDPLPYGNERRVGGVSLSLHPAGHILGSAQVQLTYGGACAVISGDYKRAADPTCRPFEPGAAISSSPRRPSACRSSAMRAPPARRAAHRLDRRQPRPLPLLGVLASASASG